MSHTPYRLTSFYSHLAKSVKGKHIPFCFTGFRKRAFDGFIDAAKAENVEDAAAALPAGAAQDAVLAQAALAKSEVGDSVKQPTDAVGELDLASAAANDLAAADALAAAKITQDQAALAADQAIAATANADLATAQAELVDGVTPEMVAVGDIASAEPAASTANAQVAADQAVLAADQAAAANVAADQTAATTATAASVAAGGQ